MRGNEKAWWRVNPVAMAMAASSVTLAVTLGAASPALAQEVAATEAVAETTSQVVEATDTQVSQPVENVQGPQQEDATSTEAGSGKVEGVVTETPAKGEPTAPEAPVVPDATQDAPEADSGMTDGVTGGDTGEKPSIEVPVPGESDDVDANAPDSTEPKDDETDGDATDEAGKVEEPGATDGDAEDGTVTETPDSADGATVDSDEEPADSNAPESGNGWSKDGQHWYENGKMVKYHAFYDKAADAWYWADADGSIATDKDVWIPVSDTDRVNGKWVRFDANRKMVKGEDYRKRDGSFGWYYFDPVTGEMQKRFAWVAKQDKWCYYDDVTGKMRYDEQYLPLNAGDKQHNWYYFNVHTGAMVKGWQFLNKGSRWVYYDDTMGWMLHGQHALHSNKQDKDLHWYYLDDYTGATIYRYKWIADQNKLVYYDDVMGWMVYGWRYIDGKTWNYFDKNTGAQTASTNAARRAYERVRTERVGVDCSTDTYVLVDKTSFRTVVFKWDGGDRVPVKDFLCAVGRLDANDGRGTFTGLWRMGADRGHNYWAAGRFYPDGYPARIEHDERARVWYRYSFNLDQGFHSCVENGKPEDEQLGKYISDGCVRLRKADAKWFWDNVPMWTNVSIYF